MSENSQPAPEENKIVEGFEKENLSENSTGVNVEQPTLNLEQNRFECRSCGYIYDPSEGNKKLNIGCSTLTPVEFSERFSFSKSSTILFSSEAGWMFSLTVYYCSLRTLKDFA